MNQLISSIEADRSYNLSSSHMLTASHMDILALLLFALLLRGKKRAATSCQAAALCSSSSYS